MKNRDVIIINKEELFDGIEILRPQQKDIIALYYNSDIEDFDLNNAYFVANFLGEKYPDNTVLIIPELANLQLIGINSLKRYIKDLQEAVDEMEESV
jgi:hypothetical protein